MDDALFSDFLDAFSPSEPEVTFFNAEVRQPELPTQQKLFPVRQASASIPNNMSFGACPVEVRTAPMVSTNILISKPVVPTTSSHLQPVSAHNKRELCGKNKMMKKRRRRGFATDDLRRNYADMIFGAINSGDVCGLLSTLERIAHPEVLLTCRFLGDPSTITAGKLYREIKGREPISKFVESMLMASPDAVLRLHEKKMRLRQNNSSYIVAKYTLEGYKFCHILTTNDKHASKKVHASLNKKTTVTSSSGSKTSSTVPSSSSHDNSEVDIFSAIFNPVSGSSSNSLGDDSDEDDWSGASQFSGSPLHFEHGMSSPPLIKLEPNMIPIPSSIPFTNDKSLQFLHSHVVDKKIQERSELLLQASQFMNRESSISGFNEKISIASATSEFGLSQSLPMPVLVSTIGTMALHINPNRQVYKIDFLWNYNQNDKAKQVLNDEMKVIQD